MTPQYFFKTKLMTMREIEVAMTVAKGLSNKEVADGLSITEKTVKFHLTRIFKKVGVKSRTQLTVLALKNDDAIV